MILANYSNDFALSPNVIPAQAGVTPSLDMLP